MPIDIQLIERALSEANDALGALRRGHGGDVQSLCYPAANTVLDAIRHLSSVRDACDSPAGITKGMVEAVKAELRILSDDKSDIDEVARDAITAVLANLPR